MIEHREHFETPLTRINYYYNQDCYQLDRLKAAFEHDDTVELKTSKRLPSDFATAVSNGTTAILIDDHEISFCEKENAQKLYNLASVLTSHLKIYT